MASISFGPRFPASAASDGGNIDLTGDHSREPDYDYVQRGTVESLRARIAALEAEVALLRGALEEVVMLCGEIDWWHRWPAIEDVARAALTASSEGRPTTAGQDGEAE